jgi:hypothetical protein
MAPNTLQEHWRIVARNLRAPTVVHARLGQLIDPPPGQGAPAARLPSTRTWLQRWSLITAARSSELPRNRRSCAAWPRPRWAGWSCRMRNERSSPWAATTPSAAATTNATRHAATVW